MSRTYWEDTPVEPLCVSNTAIVATTETGLFQASQITIPALDVRPGKMWKLTAGGLVTTGGSGTLVITPRWGTTTSGITIGANAAQTVPISITNQPWTLEFNCICRTIGLAGVNSTFIGTGFFTSNATGTAGTSFQVNFGGTSATGDPTLGGLFIGWTLSVAGSVTPLYCILQSLN